MEDSEKLYTPLPKLQSEGENFVLWKAELESAITSKGLLRYIDGRAKAPVEPAFPAKADPKAKDYDKDIATQYHKDVYTWELGCDTHAQRNERVKTMLYATIPETLKLSIMGIKTAAEAWKVICEEFENLGDLPQQSLLDHMHALRCDEDGDPRETLNELMKLKARYASSGGVLSDQEERTIIIQLLPQSWCPTIRTILASARLNSQPVTAKLLTTAIKEVCRDDATLVSKTESALAASTPTKCENCSKLGHRKVDCWAKGGGKEGKGPRQQRKAKRKNGGNSPSTAASAAPADSDAYAFTVGADFAEAAKANLHARGFTRILDSGASRHFDPNRSNFVEFREIAPKPITSADGKQFHAIGEGNVPISVLHRGQPVKIVLQNVLYAPSMPMALVSISAIAKAGFSTIFKKDGCRVCNPRQETIFVVQPRNGLYPILEMPSARTPVLPKGEAAMPASGVLQLSLTDLHSRMGHQHAASLRKMVNSRAVTGIQLTDSEVAFCPSCQEAKQR
jgi:hypothetical protein